MTPLYPGPAYRIHTQRLVLRCYEPSDAPLLKTAIDENIDHLLPWMPWVRDEPQPLQQKIELLRGFRGKFDLGQNFSYGIFDRDETRVLGGTGLHPRVGPGATEIGYWIHKDFTGQGLVTESTAALVKTAFEVDEVMRVEIHCDVKNERSAAVPRRLGFTHEVTRRKTYLFADGVYRDTMIWTLLRDEYPNSPSASAQIEAFDVVGRKII